MDLMAQPKRRISEKLEISILEDIALGCLVWKMN